MLFRSRLRTGTRKEISLGGRSSTLLIGIALILLITSGSAPSKAVRDTLSGPLRFITEPLAAAGRGIAAIGAVAADVQELRERLALTIAERDEAVASASRVASLEREITELHAVLDLRSTIRFSIVAVQVVARDFEIGRRVAVSYTHLTLPTKA